MCLRHISYHSLHTNDIFHYQIPNGSILMISRQAAIIHIFEHSISNFRHNSAPFPVKKIHRNVMHSYFLSMSISFTDCGYFLVKKCQSEHRSTNSFFVSWIDDSIKKIFKEKLVLPSSMMAVVTFLPVTP